MRNREVYGTIVGGLVGAALTIGILMWLEDWLQGLIPLIEIGSYG